MHLVLVGHDFKCGRVRVVLGLGVLWNLCGHFIVVTVEFVPNW